MKRYDWIVFDSTGTLMTPDPEPAAVYHQVAAQWGCVTDLDQVRVNLKAAMAEHFFADTAFDPTTEENEWERWNKIVADTLPGLDPAVFPSAFSSLWKRFAAAEAWRLFDDVLPAIERLRSAGYSLAIASNFDRRLGMILDEMGVADRFDRVLISSDLGWSKPNKAFFDAARDRLHGSDSHRLLMIGDTKRGDVDAAVEAGWDARLLVREKEDALLRLTEDLL